MATECDPRFMAPRPARTYTCMEIPLGRLVPERAPSMLERGEIIGLYCSDVSGAFDRVRRNRLSAKLHCTGLHHKGIRILESWLENRRAIVIVSGSNAAEMELIESVFQGTVLGPVLWYLFYADTPLAT